MNQDTFVNDDSTQKQKRRNFLIGVAGSLGVGSGLLGAFPFLASLRPSRQAQAAGAPVRVDLEGIRPGELRKTIWRKKLVWALARNQKMIQIAKDNEKALSDPDSEFSLQPEYCKNPLRSRREEFFIAIGLCTHLGCSPKWEAEEGFFYCACHGSRFDAAGRVVAGSPAPLNLVIPPYYFDEQGNVVVGIDEKSA